DLEEDLVLPLEQDLLVVRPARSHHRSIEAQQRLAIERSLLLLAPDRLRPGCHGSSGWFDKPATGNDLEVIEGGRDDGLLYPYLLQRASVGVYTPARARVVAWGRFEGSCGVPTSTMRRLAD